MGGEDDAEVQERARQGRRGPLLARHEAAAARRSSISMAVAEQCGSQTSRGRREGRGRVVHSLPELQSATRARRAGGQGAVPRARRAGGRGAVPQARQPARGHRPPPRHARGRARRARLLAHVHLLPAPPPPRLHVRPAGAHAPCHGIPMVSRVRASPCRPSSRCSTGEGLIAFLC